MQVESTSDARTINNVARHEYRVLSDAEKAQMKAVKDVGADFIELIDSLRPAPVREINSEIVSVEVVPDYDRAIEKVQEAIFWAVHGLTAPRAEVR